MTEEDRTLHIDDSELAALRELAAEAREEQLEGSRATPSGFDGVDRAALDQLAALAEGRVARPAPPRQSPSQGETEVVDLVSLERETFFRQAPASDSTSTDQPVVSRTISAQPQPEVVKPRTIAPIQGLAPHVSPMPQVERSAEPWHPPERIVMPTDPERRKAKSTSRWLRVMMVMMVVIIVLLAAVTYLVLSRTVSADDDPQPESPSDQVDEGETP